MRKARILPGYVNWYREVKKPFHPLTSDGNEVVVVNESNGVYECRDRVSIILYVPKRFIEFLDDTAPEADKP